jgi:hypothetical protein
MMKDFTMLDGEKVSGYGASSKAMIGKAKHPDLVKSAGRTTIVVKVFKEHRILSQKAHCEIAIMSLFHHPNVIEIIGYSDVPCCLLMRFYKGTLGDYIQKQKLSVTQIHKIIKGLAAGLQGYI